jgi:hypothetical protein
LSWQLILFVNGRVGGVIEFRILGRLFRQQMPSILLCNYEN